MIIRLTLARSTLNTFSVSEVYVCQNKSFHSFVFLQLFNSIYETALRKTACRGNWRGGVASVLLKLAFFLTFFSPQIKSVRINIIKGSKSKKKDFKIAPSVRNTAARVSDTYRSFLGLW